MVSYGEKTKKAGGGVGEGGGGRVRVDQNLENEK